MENSFSSLIPLKSGLCFSHSLLENSDFPLTYCTLNISHGEMFILFSFRCFEAVPDLSCRFYLKISGKNFVSCDFSAEDENFSSDKITLFRYGGEDLEGIYWGADLKIPSELLFSKENYTLSIKYQGKNQCSSPFPTGKTGFVMRF